ncbi:MAG: flagellin [Phycisphaerales bacterium]|nr:flagellin [Phycisphaerales bacterium]
MSRINTNVQSLIARRVFDGNNTSLNRALTRLSTGLRINSGRDDPAGLIASETLRSSKVALTAATDNARRADTILSISEGGLQEVNALLLDLEDLIDRSANEGGLNDAEIRANQLQIDSILTSINRLANSTAFGDKKLLDGTAGFTTSSVTTSKLALVAINSAKVPDNSFRNVSVEVLNGSTFAFVSAYGNERAGTPLTIDGQLSGVVTLQIAGYYGTEVINFASGATQAQIAAGVNASTQLTGVSATTSAMTGGPTAVIFASTIFGSKGFVSVDVITNAVTGLNLGGGARSVTRNGVDGTININGQVATVDGLNASISSGTLAADLILTQSFGTTDGGSSTFQITGGGARFQIGPEASLSGQETIGVDSVSTASLGDAVTGFLATLQSGQTNDLNSKNFADAQRVVRRAVEQVSSLRGRIGAFQKNTLGSAINSMLVAFENTSAAESAIRDADFAVEASNLTRAQILVNASTSTLQLANAGPQNVLALLG